METMARALGTGSGLRGLAANVLREKLISVYWSIVVVTSCSRAELLFVAANASVKENINLSLFFYLIQLIYPSLNIC